MTERIVRINSMKEADEFNKICSKFACDMDLASGKYYVDAKSIMGIFSLDLTRPLTLTVHGKDELEEINSAIAPYLKK